jgi:Family of unknown function (DUF6600)/FecR protein
MPRPTKAVLAALLIALAGAGAVRAQYDNDDNYGYSDPDIRQTVARLAYVSGDVSFARGDDPDDWQPANANIPMTLGDRTWTSGGRLELQVHGGNLIRLAQSTDLAALNLTEDTKQFSLSAGVASFRIRRLGDEEVFEVDTPNAAITFERTGDYRIDVRPDGDTRVQVRRGRAIVASGGGQVPLGSGDAMLIEGYEPPRYDMIGMAPADGWDRWVADRDARYANVRSYDYVSADIAGVEDLDRYGRWQQVPSYGWCWTPATVTVGWQPYRVGRWIWQDPWGWTWVSSEPWGWAPYHYGRWVTWNSGWFWVPVAPRVAVATYSPALVAFVGGGPGFSVSVGLGTDYIGWFPLAPRDPLIPWWGRPTTVVNVTNITYVNRTYVTVVNQNTFVTSRAVTTNYVRDKAIINRVERAPVVRGAIPIAPTRESIRVATRQAAAPRPPAAVTSRAVVTRMAPPPAPPRFDQKVAAIRENRGRPVTTVEAEKISTREGRTAAPTRAVRPAAQESGSVTLAPKNDNARAPKPEPVAPSRGRQLATKEQPVAPSQETSAQRGRSAAPQRETQSEGAPKDQEQEQRDQAARQAREKAQDQTQSERIQREQVERQQDRRQPAQREPAEKPQAPSDQAQREQAQKQQAQREQAQKQQAEKQQAQREQAERQQAQREQAQKQQAEKQQAQREQAERQQAQREQAQKQQAQREQAERQQAQREQAERQQAQRPQPEKPKPAQEPQHARPTPRPAPESEERAQPPSNEKEKPASSSSSARGKGRPTPKPTPDKKGD